MPILIISGTPGSGKSSVSRWLAAKHESGVHLESDRFFRFLAHRIDPSQSDSRKQNETVVRAYAEAAKVYSAGGYAVYLDGVIGPWLFPLIAPVLGSFDYVLLHASEAVASERMRGRGCQASAEPEVAARMHSQFQAVLSSFPHHVVRTDEMSVEEVAAEIESRQARAVLTIGGA